MHKLAAIAARETAQLTDFIALLKLEQDALKRADAGALPAISEQKLRLVEALNAIEKERSTALGADTGEHAHSAMTRWLAANPEQKNIAAGWKNLMDLAREAKQLHELNGQLIKIHLQQTGELLAALTQQYQKNTLYGSDGQASSTSGSRIVDSA
jgi:flagella synthesis protein FlgN